MGITVAPFSHEHFQSLPPLNAAVENYHNLDGPKLVQGVFKEFFVKHGMEYTFGLALPHRHFDLKPGTRLVSYNGVSTPWPTEPGIGMQEPSPSNWSFSADGKLFPTEFRYAKGHTFHMGEREEAFVAEFKAELDRLGLGQLFGLCEYPGNDFEGSFEITRGNSNINLEPKDVCIKIQLAIIVY